jgi:hypothetical protein
MGYCVASDAEGVIWFVVLNSFVHSVMYVYYACATLHIRCPFKHWITRLQIGQFFFGISLVISHLASDCSRGHVRASMAILGLYVLYLAFLFLQFYRRAYRKKAEKAEVSTEVKKEL